MKMTDEQLRDIIVRINDMATGRFVQSDTVIRDRIAALAKQTVMADDIMRGFLGYGGPEEERDILTGSGSLKNSEESKSWYKKWLDEHMKDPEFKAGYEEHLAELIDEEKMITELKRLLFKAMPYIRADADYALTEECNDHERANESRRLLNEINEALKEEKAK